MNSISVKAWAERESAVLNVKKGIWLYFYLLIFEGALRKWGLPDFSEPLLIIRDPLAIYLLFKSVQANLWRPNRYVILLWGISVMSFIITLVIGHGNLTIAVYGLRIFVLHFPLIFIIGSLFNKADVHYLGQIMLWLTIGMTLLVAVQFFSPQGAWVNRGLGGDLEGSGFSGAAGFYRVPGTFSFTNGLSKFYGFAAAFIFYFWITKDGKVSRWLLAGSTIALLAAIPLSISRTVLFEVALTLLFMVIITGRNIKIMSRLLGVSIVVLFLVLLLSSLDFFQVAKFAFLERFTNANATEGGLQGVFVDRFLGGMFGALTNENFSFWGEGLGMGTNVAAKLTTGNAAFLISEGEWGRLIGEMGIILGFLIILIRSYLVLIFLNKAWDSLKYGNILPWMLMSFGIINLLQGQWAQPTSLGFGILIGGLVIASFRSPDF